MGQVPFDMYIIEVVLPSYQRLDRSHNMERLVAAFAYAQMLLLAAAAAAVQPTCLGHPSVYEADLPKVWITLVCDVLLQTGR